MRFGPARDLGVVERDLAEVVQQRRHLEVVEVGLGQTEVVAHRPDQRRDPFRVPGRHQPPELRRHRERLDRLAVRQRGRVEPLERVPGGEQRGGEEHGPQMPSSTFAVDPAVADGHQHPRRRDRQPREAAARRETSCRRFRSFAAPISVTNCASAAAASATSTAATVSCCRTRRRHAAVGRDASPPRRASRALEDLGTAPRLVPREDRRRTRPARRR